MATDRICCVPDGCRIRCGFAPLQMRDSIFAIRPQRSAAWRFAGFEALADAAWSGKGKKNVSFESVRAIMLQRNMKTAMSLQLGLEDLIADLRHSRKCGDLGRLAFVAYCDVRRWARAAGETELADNSSRVITDSPHESREAFLGYIDELIDDLERRRFDFGTTSPAGLDFQAVER